MVFSVPAGILADRIGRSRVLLGGYLVLALVYIALVGMPQIGWPGTLGCLALMGIYYAATEGILMALASAVVPARLRTSGLALIGTAIGIGKMLSSVVFGWLWSGAGQLVAIVSFIAGLALMVVIAIFRLKAVMGEQAVVQAK
jgi:MFS family permease